MKRIAERLRASPTSPGDAPGRPAVSAGDCGLLLIRMTFGLLMAGHGAQKLFGIFGGMSLDETAKGFAGLGYQPGKAYAVIAGASELLGGLGLALGLLTPLAAAAVIGVMINAMVTVTAAHGLWAVSGGMEYNLGIAVVALGIAAIGPGRLALDRPFRWGKGGWREAGVALALGGIGAAIVLSI
ncbi:DoxX family protein [Streptomyces sp. NPDC048483]|uniref:DoxX family protein n=1 Tax=Streptomyces sp. NPDC048483 TaxID=3154927 RepID=UPI003426284B